MTEFMVPPSKVIVIRPTVEKDLPMPLFRQTKLKLGSGNRERGYRVEYPFKKMDLGDSFFVQGNARNTLKVCCHHITRKTGMRFATRQWREPDGKEGLRCWRVF
jgi:hypothetical protein